MWWRSLNRSPSAWLSALGFYGASLFAISLPTLAQQVGKVHRIGYLSRQGSSPEQAFVQALRDLGYFEGKNITIEYRSAKGNWDRLPDLAADLVRLKVDIIVTNGSPPTLAAKRATSSIPIVMTSSSDPVGNGLVTSLARPGGNVTGLTSLSPFLGGKRLELLKEVIPGLSRVVIPGPAGARNFDLYIKESEIPAGALNVQLVRFDVRGPEDFESVFQVASKERVNALMSRLSSSYTPSAQRKRFVELAAKNRLPAIYQSRDWAEDGGLLSYGRDGTERYRRAAAYVDKILKGVKPGDLPVEAPTKFELVVNLRAARQMGLTIPPEVLMRADRVIK